MTPASSSIQIRLAGPADADQLARCRLDLFTELRGGLDPAGADGFLSHGADALRRYFETDRVAAWIAEAAPDGENVGSLILLLYPRLPSFHNLRTEEGYLINVYVAAARRRQGIASALMETALADGRRRRLARIRLHASPEGRLGYQQLGFRGRDDEMELDFVTTDEPHLR